MSVIEKVIGLTREVCGDAEALEALYSACMYEGECGEFVLWRDFKVRYGERARYLMSLAAQVMYLDAEDKRRVQNEIYSVYGHVVEELVRRRVLKAASSSEEVAKLLWFYVNYCMYETDIEVLDAMLKLGVGRGCDELIRLGVLLHASDDSVVAPYYSMKILSEVSERLDVRYEPPDAYRRFMEVFEAEPYMLSAVEADLMDEEVDEEFFNALYGVEYADVLESLEILGVCRYVESRELIVYNPVFSREDLLAELLNVKKSLAKKFMKPLIDFPLMCEDDRSLNAEVCYLVTGRGTPLAIVFTPWFTPVERVFRWYRRGVRVFFVMWKPSREFADYMRKRRSEDWRVANIAWLFTQPPDTNTVYVLWPEVADAAFKNLVEDMKDAGLNVIEL